MRDRHLPRLCHSCGRPMARQQDTCWRCGTRWATEHASPPTLQLLVSEAPTHVVAVPGPAIAVAVAGPLPASTEAAADADRWIDDGGNFAAEAALLPLARAAR